MSDLSKEQYVADVSLRWGGGALRNAMRNWRDFEDIHEQLRTALIDFHRDPFLRDVLGKCHNPEGTLTAFLWKLQESFNSDRSCLRPLLDFEEYFQKVFLRRGLVTYCKLILATFETKRDEPLLEHCVGSAP